jgi:hypothetical protein
MTVQFEDFYQNWLRKADSYTNDSLENHFDKFISLFIIYNFFYLEIKRKLALSEASIGKNVTEKTLATVFVVQYLKASRFINLLLDDEQRKGCLSEICAIIENESFYIIHSTGGEPLVDSDKRLLKKLKSNEKQEKSVAILSLFYHIRCNLFHGRKGFEEEQKKLLVPMNILLRKIIEIIYDNLKNSDL